MKAAPPATPTPMPRTPPIAPSTIPLDDSTRNRVDRVAPTLAIVASVRCCCRAVTVNAAPARRITSKAAKPAAIAPTARIARSELLWSLVRLRCHRRRAGQHGAGEHGGTLRVEVSHLRPRERCVGEVEIGLLQPFRRRRPGEGALAAEEHLHRVRLGLVVEDADDRHRSRRRSIQFHAVAELRAQSGERGRGDHHLGVAARRPAVEHVEMAGERRVPARTFDRVEIADTGRRCRRDAGAVQRQDARAGGEQLGWLLEVVHDGGVRWVRRAPAPQMRVGRVLYDGWIGRRDDVHPSLGLAQLGGDGFVARSESCSGRPARRRPCPRPAMRPSRRSGHCGRWPGCWCDARW